MKARIEKKLSKRIVKLMPEVFKDAWVDKDISEAAEEQGSKVSHVLSVGGGVDYWGEGEDVYTAWEWFRMNFEWLGKFEPYPAGHKFEHYPNISGFKPTTRNLLKLARSISA